MGADVCLGAVASAGVNMDLSYALTPFLAWLVAGVLKFVVNSLRAGKLAFGLIGYGGLPKLRCAFVTAVKSTKHCAAPSRRP